MDLTDLVQDYWEEDLEQEEFDEQLKVLNDEYREIEKELTKLDEMEARAYTIECARLCTQLRIVVKRGSEGSTESEDVSEADEGESEDELVEEKYLGELLTRKEQMTEKR
jgi:hypothetical protein